MVAYAYPKGNGAELSKFSVNQFSAIICIKLHVMPSLKIKLRKLQFTVSVQLCSHVQLCFSVMYTMYDNEKDPWYIFCSCIHCYSLSISLCFYKNIFQEANQKSLRSRNQEELVVAQGPYDV